MTYYDPFEPGDVIWFEHHGEPLEFWVKRESDWRRVSIDDTWTFETIMEEFEGFSGPYKLDQSSNWTIVDFTDPDVKRHYYE